MSTWSWDLDTDLLSWKSGLEASEEVRGCDFEGTFEAFRALAHPEDRERIDTTIRNAIDQGGEFELEYPHAPPGWLGELALLARKGRRRREWAGRPVDRRRHGHHPAEGGRDRVAALRADLESRIRELEMLLELLPVGVAIAEDPLCRKIRANNTCSRSSERRRPTTCR